jgi:hypothetical protein
MQTSPFRSCRITSATFDSSVAHARRSSRIPRDELLDESLEGVGFQGGMGNGDKVVRAHAWPALSVDFASNTASINFAASRCSEHYVRVVVQIPLQEW